MSFRNAHVHMVGIGGSGMSGLAMMLLARQAVVTGSDREHTPMLRRLQLHGARVSSGSPEPLPPQTQLVVASAAIPTAHPELVEARQRNVPILKYAEMLGRLMQDRHGVAIAGTHGKSTTTAWLTYVLRCARLDPSFVIGADVEQLGGGSGVGDGAHFVAEACEYDRSFVNLRPRAAAILNIEEDHLDYYESLDEILHAFIEFGQLIPDDGLMVINAADANCLRVAEHLRCRVRTFGEAAGCDVRAANLAVEAGRFAFDVREREQLLGRVHVGLSGRHNVHNALAVIALGREWGLTWETIRSGLEAFGGAKRRLEQRGCVRSVTVADDYAHHPTEIRATLQAARERYNPKRVWCVFQPHQHSRTRFLLEDFAGSFALADTVVVPDIYFVRDSLSDRDAVQSADLVERIKACGGSATHIASFAQIVETIAAQAAPGDLVLTMGAGDIWKVADDLVQRLEYPIPA